MGTVEENAVNNVDGIHECRTCLQANDPVSLFLLFQSWSPSWGEMESTIAEDLAKIANIQISESDRHSKYICISCSEQLKAACQFISLVKKNDRILRLRNPPTSETVSCEEVWPKPIQIDKPISYENMLDVDIKQEVLSEDDYDYNTEEDSYREPAFANQIEIKVEPEEIIAPDYPQLNGTTSHNFDNEDITIENGDLHYEEEFLDDKVKEEPISDPEDSEVMPSDLPLDCLLCTRKFLSVTGLKAHVIAQHSYKTIKRRVGGSSPQKTPKTKYTCAICKRSFLTTTDLMVHETCHNKDVCYGCNAKFDSFDKLTAHRKRCKAILSKEVVKPKTLDDVIRPQIEEAEAEVKEIEKPKETKTESSPETLTCDLCSEQFSDPYYMNIHLEIHHSKENTDLQLNNGPIPMEIEALQDIFNEDT